MPGAQIPQGADPQLELIKAGAFSVYQQAGIPQDQWETKLASYLDAADKYQKAAALCPEIERAIAARKTQKAAALAASKTTAAPAAK